jgi:hypothetical protein
MQESPSPNANTKTNEARNLWGSLVVVGLCCAWVVGLAMDEMPGARAARGTEFEQMIGAVRWCAFFLMFVAAASVKYLLSRGPRA